jgi:hypothetical protein
VRTNGDIRKETALGMQMVDFGIGGIKMENSNVFMAYILGKDHQSMPLDEKVRTLESVCTQNPQRSHRPLRKSD